jgi:hypothetical protein
MERYVTTDGIMLYDVGCKDKHVSIWSYRSWKLDVYIVFSYHVSPVEQELLTLPEHMS